MSALMCAICLFREDGEEPNEAWTVINGQAVCEEHHGYAQGGSFSAALSVLRDEMG